MRNDIYAMHEKAFPNVSAYVVMLGDERVATIAFKFPKDGASRLWAYVHWTGIPMVRGYSTGYGYDKKTAAIESAVGNLPEELPVTSYADGVPHYQLRTEYALFRQALLHGRNDGECWDNRIRGLSVTFNLFQAV